MFKRLQFSRFKTPSSRLGRLILALAFCTLTPNKHFSTNLLSCNLYPSKGFDLVIIFSILWHAFDPAPLRTKFLPQKLCWYIICFFYLSLFLLRKSLYTISTTLLAIMHVQYTFGENNTGWDVKNMSKKNHSIRSKMYSEKSIVHSGSSIV